MGLRDEYPYIWADCILWGSYRYYFEQMLELARETDAPKDAVSYRGSPGHPDFAWRRFPEYDPIARDRMQKVVDGEAGRVVPA